MKRAYIVVEGPHDVEFVARLLKPAGFERVKDFEQLDPEWRHLVPTKFPHRGDLLKRVPVPTFLRNATHSVALDSATGITEIVPRLEESCVVLASQQVHLDCIGVILDADDDGHDPAARYTQLRTQLEIPNLSAFRWPPRPGDVMPGPPRCGVFVLPDNRRAGTLEDLLIAASDAAYPGLHADAAAFVERVVADPTALGLINKDLKDLRKPAGERKATLATVASVLKPGKSIAVAIQDCRWLDRAALQQLPLLAAVQAFLHQLLELP